MMISKTAPFKTAIRCIAGAVTLAVFALNIGCGTLLNATPGCPISDVTARASGESSRYSFSVDCGAFGGEVDAAYDNDSGIAVEQVKGPLGTAAAKWFCKTDPWIAEGVDNQVCTRLQAEGSSLKDGPINLTVIYNTSYSAWVLTPHFRHVLNLQLQNSIKANSQPAPSPVEVVLVEDARLNDTLCLICDAAKPAPKKDPIADLAVVSIAGPTTRQAGLSGTYTVTIKNQGDKNATVELGIVFAGKLDQTGQVVAGAGLTCDLREDKGINAALYCTGGTLAASQTATVVVQGRGQAAGAGMLIANLNPSRTVTESTYDNNFKQLNVAIN